MIRQNYSHYAYDFVGMIEELCMDGVISLGKCCRSTAYRTVNAVNAYLEKEKADWRAKLVIEKGEQYPYTLKVADAA